MQKKLIAVFCVYLLAFSMLYMRIGMICTDDSLKEVGNNQSSYTLSFNQTRGQIYDCRFIPLVNEKVSYLAAVLPTPKNISTLQSNMVLKKTDDFDKLITSRKPFLLEAYLPTVNVPQVKVFSVPKRYSNDQLAQHTIGYIDTTRNKGMTGIEAAFDILLAANSEKSKISYRLNGLGEPLYGAEPEVDLGKIRMDGVVLTIDRRIQEICEDVGTRYMKKGAIVVMEPSTGKLKAIASFPNYKASDISKAVKDTENSPLLNRAYNAYPVGSTFKIVTAATALSQGVSPATTFLCKGSTKIGEVEFGCHEKAGHGVVDMKQAMAVSCNPYFIHLSTLINKQGFLNMASDFSFGKANELASGLKTASGKVPTVDQLFNPGAVANLSFGQGALTATPIQVAQMMSAVVNQGNLIPASLVEGYTKDGKTYSERKQDSYPIKTINQNVAKLLQEYMVYAVMDTPGQNAKPVNTTAGGKTGTAQTGQFAGKEEILQGWFAGFYPANEPKYVIVVTVEEARSGNQDASPVFREIVDTLTAPIVMPKDLQK